MSPLAELSAVNISKGYLLAVAGALAILSILLVQPVIEYVLGAVLIAYVLSPVQRRLERYVSSKIAALALVLAATAIIVTPFVVVIATIADDASRILRNLDAQSIDLGPLEARVEAFTGRELDIVGELASAARDFGLAIVEESTSAFSTITYLLIGSGLALFLVYYLLKDRERFMAWLRETVPVPVDIQNELYAEIDDLIWGVLFGHVFVAIVQGVVAGIGFIILGVPNAIFWTAVMVVLAMVPLIGAIPVWGGAVAYLYLTDGPLIALALFIYSVIVVGATDDYLRPFAVERYARLNPAVILLGILGGAYAFGIIGLFFGPVILGGFKKTLQVVTEHWNRLSTTAT